MALSYVTENNNRPNLIIFIHGFLGGKETWERIDNEKSILDYLKTDVTINKNFDFAIFDYYTKVTDIIDKTKKVLVSLIGKKTSPSKNIDIDEIGLMLKTEIEFNARGRKNIVLITHSMGGLVAKSMILKELDVTNKSSIDLYISLAVPHNGTDLATLGKLIFGNPQIESLSPLNQKIHEMNNKWILKSESLPATVYFRGMYDNIFPKTSSISFDKRENIEPVDTDDDHTGIVHPNSKDDVIISAIKFYLDNLLKEQATTLTSKSFKLSFFIESVVEFSNFAT